MRERRAMKCPSLLLTALLCACGADGPGSRTTTIGRHDGGDEPNDPSPRDGSVDDGGHDVMSGETVLCRYDDDDVYELEANESLRGLSSATNERGFALLHHAEDGALLIEAAEIGEAAQPSVQLVPAANAPGRALITASGSAFSMLWMDGEALSVRRLESGADTYALSDSVATGADDAPLFAFVANDDGSWAGYAEHAGDQVVVRVQAIGTTGALDGDPVAIELPEDSAPQHIELAKLDRGFLLAFSEADPEEEDSLHVMGLVLSELLEASGEPKQLSKTPVAQASFALDARAGSAGVIYQGLEGGVRPTVKVQRVETTGNVSQDSLNIASAPRRLSDGSIAAFGQGYAVAYRALSSLGSEMPGIHIAFVNQFGLVVHDALLSDTTEPSGPTSIAATADGKLLASWSSLDGGTPTTHAIQLDCPGALILCGGQVD